MTEFVAQISDSFRPDCERCMAAALGDDNETFQWLAYAWDVSKARQIVKDGRLPVWFPTDHLRLAFALRAIDAAHVEHVPLDEPCIVAVYPGLGKAKFSFPIDGTHRIVARHGRGLTATQCYVLTEGESDAIRCDTPVKTPRRRAKTRTYTG